jgi:hypothetical protein
MELEKFIEEELIIEVPHYFYEYSASSKEYCKKLVKEFANSIFPKTLIKQKIKNLKYAVIGEEDYQENEEEGCDYENYNDVDCSCSRCEEERG